MFLEPSDCPVAYIKLSPAPIPLFNILTPLWNAPEPDTVIPSIGTVVVFAPTIVTCPFANTVNLSVPAAFSSKIISLPALTPALTIKPALSVVVFKFLILDVKEPLFT